MKYEYTVSVKVSLSPDVLKRTLNGIDPSSTNADDAITKYAQSIIDEFALKVEASKKSFASSISDLYQSTSNIDPNDFRLDHGPGGC